MTNNVTYKKESIEELKKNIHASSEKLVEYLKKIFNETNKMDSFYNTEAGKLFKEKLMEYLNNQIKYINDNYLGLNDILNVISTEYENYFADVKKNVGGN